MPPLPSVTPVSVSRLIILFVLFAEAVQFELSATEVEAVFVGDFDESGSDCVVVKLHDFPTLNADEVVVVGVLVVDGIITSLSVTEVFCDGKAEVDEQFEGTVNGGVPDALVVLPYFGEKFVGRNVFVNTEEGLHNGVALASGLESLFLETGVEGIENNCNAIVFFVACQVIWSRHVSGPLFFGYLDYTRGEACDGKWVY